jgi:hypothetical protein
MAWNDSIDGTPVYLEKRPDYSGDVSFVPKWQTLIATAHSGAEQRARLRDWPKREIAYQVRAQDRDSFPARRAAVLNELYRPVVVPLWMRRHSVTRIEGTADRYAVSLPSGYTSVEDTDFREDGIVYLQETGQTSVFAQIIDWQVLATDNFLLDVSAPLYPAVSWPSFTTAAVIFPCIKGMREDNAASFSLNRVDRTDERIHIVEL